MRLLRLSPVLACAIALSAAPVDGTMFDDAARHVPQRPDGPPAESDDGR